MAFSVDDFIGDILKDVQVDTSQRDSLLAIAKNPTVAKRLEEAALRQADYSSKIADAQKGLKDNKDYWERLNTWEKTKTTEFSNIEKELKKKLIDNDVDLDADRNTGVNAQQLEELARQQLAYGNALTRLGMQHLKDYNEVIDPDKLLEIAAKERVNINQAYEIYSKPKREEIQKTEYDKALAKAREEGKEEAIKNYQVPVADASFNNGQTHDALDRLANKNQADQFGVPAALKAYTENMRRGKTASA